MACSRQIRRGYTLAEMLVVVTLVAVLAWTMIPSMTPSASQQLLGTAETVASDLALARSLAVANGSTYRVTYQLTQNRYVLEHTGTNPALETLPHWAFRSPSDPADQHIVELSKLPNSGFTLPALASVTLGGTSTASTWIEFTPLGATSAAAESVVWLQTGSATSARYVAVRVNPVTGLTTIDDITGTAPAGAGIGGG
ncbi:MAG: GspH/FimT family pseudopilin [Pirellulales bacterium]|nr:GspH/FimT family pseudopilin [Pirellulales bacterium]